MLDVINSFLNPYIGPYTPMVDVCVLLLATYLMGMLSPFTSMRDKNNRTLLVICLMLLDFASLSNILSHHFSNSNPVYFCILIEFLKCVYAVNLAMTFYIFVIFYWSLTHAPNNIIKHNTMLLRVSIVTYIFIRFICFLVTILLPQYKLLSDSISIDIAILYYIILGVDVIVSFVKFDRRNNMIHYYVKISALCTYLLLAITVVCLHTVTYAALLFFLPMLSLSYFHHSYSFDVATGAVDYNGLKHYLRKTLVYGSKTSYCGTLVEFVSNDLLNDYVSTLFNDKSLKNVRLFLYKSVNQYIYLYDKQDAEIVRAYLKHSFDNCHVHHMSFSFDDLSDEKTILSVVCGVFSTCTYSGASKWEILNDKDVNRFVRLDSIRSGLLDICDKQDLNDPRVLVYCQPIYNTHTGVFDTAEALMRMELPDLGFIYPNEFIPIAEEFHLIHSLTLVILNKVSAFIEKCNLEGYNITRISINFSMDEFRNKNICNEIYDIIGQYSIENNQIALELTESIDNIDVDILASYLNDIKSHNILLYLDDFGTGYSNFSRIYELPFDVIKFDMHLLTNASNGKAKSINSIIPSFKDNGFKLVHEGVETDNDENRCINLGFDYLQGYKYSKPIPIEELVSFLKKKSEKN